jgi:hypothetical protein
LKINNRQQFLVILAGLSVALLLGDRLVVTPLTRLWKDRSDRIAELDKEVSQGTLLIDREQIIRHRWESMRTNTLPGNASTAENLVLKSFDRWSKTSQISITSIKPQWRQSGENYLTLECRADGFGSLDAITRFLFEVEKDPLALKVESVELAARDKDGSQLTLGLQVSGLLLNAKEP